MDNANLFQLGIGLATGTQAEVSDAVHRGVAANDSVQNEEKLKLVSNLSREDHFVQRDGKVFAGTHLIIEVLNGAGFDDEALFVARS